MPASLRDIHFRHGQLLAEVAQLTARVETLETLIELQTRTRRSMRPTVERIGISAVVAGVVAGIVQGLAQLFR